MKPLNSIEPSTAGMMNNSMEEVYELPSIESIVGREESIKTPRLMTPKLATPKKPKPKEHIRVAMPKYRQRQKLREVTGSCCHSFYDAVNLFCRIFYFFKQIFNV